jgi:hypothetical protein
MKVKPVTAPALPPGQLDLTTEQGQLVAFLLVVLGQLTRNTLNPDVIYLALLGAKEECVRLGLDPAVLPGLADKFNAAYMHRRGENPLSKLFDGN